MLPNHYHQIMDKLNRYQVLSDTIIDSYTIVISLYKKLIFENHFHLNSFLQQNLHASNPFQNHGE